MRSFILGVLAAVAIGGMIGEGDAQLDHDTDREATEEREACLLLYPREYSDKCDDHYPVMCGDQAATEASGSHSSRLEIDASLRSWANVQDAIQDAAAALARLPALQSTETELGGWS